jgi:hypothetical protein
MLMADRCLLAAFLFQRSANWAKRRTAVSVQKSAFTRDSFFPIELTADCILFFLAFIFQQ